MENVPKTLDWVKARAECSLEHLFMLLREVVDSDVKAMQARKADHRRDFSLGDPNQSKFVVSKAAEGEQPFRGVIFERASQGIRVMSATRTGFEEMFVAKPSLDVAGSCRLEVGGQPLELWQVSRKALEDLFFE
jgi:hypothetical protein